MLQALLLSAFAGAMIPLGGWLACFRQGPHGGSGPVLPSTVIAFGGGALLSAVAFVLVPEGAEKLPGWLAVALFGAGGVAFAWISRAIDRIGGSHGQMLAMLADFIPEAAALGALLAAGGGDTAILLAGLIALQNLPEGFNAWCEGEDTNPRRRLALFWGLAALGPVAALGGHVFLSDYAGVLGGLMVFAAGGIVYLIFEDIAPAGHLPDRRAPPLGAVMGFALGFAGHLAVG